MADVETLCAILLQRKDYVKGTPIRLISCLTGKEIDGVAEFISKKLETRVIAPTDLVWVHGNGTMTIGDSENSDSGYWEEFSDNLYRYTAED